MFMKNTKRAAEVWMDKYKEYYFAAVPAARKVSAGNIQDRLKLKRDLGCKSFGWFLENVYPQLRVPDNGAVAFGAIKHKEDDECLDTMGHLTDGTLGVYPCHGSGGNQEFSWVKNKQLKHLDLCLTIADPPKAGSEVKMKLCTETDNVDQTPRNEMWDVANNSFRMVGTQLCLHVLKVEGGQKVTVQQCDRSKNQQWKFTMSGISK